MFTVGKNPKKKKPAKEEALPNNENEVLPKERNLPKNIQPQDNSMSIDESGFIPNNNNSLEISTFPQKKQEKKKMEKNVEGENENELKVSNAKLFEGLACLYQKQQQLEENQKRMEEKLDKILSSLLIGKKMQIE